MTEGAPAQAPNILLILTDDQGWWDVGVHGNQTIETPVMDQLSRDGVSFNRFYVEPVCSPTRAGLMTGRYFLRTGVYNTRFGGDTLGAGEITLPELLKAAGYRTALFGKWHLGSYARFQPNSRGFDEFLGFLHGHTERYDYPDALMHNREKVAARGYITDILTDAAIQFVTTHRAEPFFCYLAYNVPHSPYIAGDAHDQQEPWDKLIQKYLAKGAPMKSARIYAMIERCDQDIGRLLKTIDDLQLREKTIVLFMSDNGGVHTHFKAGLKGAKASVWEGGVRAPLFVRWPGHFPAGAKLDAIASHVDLLPTLCELAGARPPADRPLDGRSLAPLLRTGQGESPHQYVYHQWDRNFPNPTNNWAIGGQRYKLANGQLFDLANDPGETKNIAKQQPELAQQLQAEYLRWFKEVTAGQTYEPAPIELGRAEENPVEIQASWAKLDGTNTQYTFAAYDWDTLSGWKSPADKARWRIDVTRPGNYEITVSYSARPQSAGSTFRVALGGKELQGTAEPTLNPNTFIQRRLGVVSMEAGATLLEIHPLETKENESITLNRVWLRKMD